MKIDIIGAKLSWENKQLKKEIKKRGFDCDFVDPRKISYFFENNKLKLYLGNKLYKLPNAVLCRGGFISKIENSGRMFVNTLNELGVKIIESPDAIYRDKDKLFFAMLFQKHKIPHPKTLYLKNSSLLKKIDFKPVVVKDLRGKQGIGIFKNEKLEKLPAENYFIQSLISNSHVDNRVFVVGNEVVGAIERRAGKKGEWRSNVSLGGKTKAVKVDEETRKLALKAVKACKYEVAGVDVLTDMNGTKYIIEVNRAPQFRGLMKATKINVPKKIIDYILSKIK